MLRLARVGVVGAAMLLAACGSRLSEENFAKVKDGMSEQDVIAILGTPRFEYFGPGHLNVWVMQPPFVWLPAVMVLAALAGHLLVFRALVLQRR